ncbi:MAG TPA: GxxExxY protein [Paludibacter sp.]
MIYFKDESYKIIGSCFKVHSELGPGFSESVYQEALSIQFRKDDIPFEREKILNVYFDGEKLKKHFKSDFVCFDSIIVELKAHPFIHNDNIEQTRNCLKSTKLKLGLLINFGEMSLTYKRVINL